MNKYNIVKCVSIVSNENGIFLFQFLGGSQQGIKKNPHVIDVDLDLDMPLNCWFIT
jgi:hypothetical protein